MEIFLNISINKMVFETGRIYKIVSDSTNKIQIGSTSKTLDERLEVHESDYENWFNSDFKAYYCTSFEILKYGDYKILLLEEIVFSCKKDLLKLEGRYQIKNYYDCVNSTICIERPRTNKIDENEFYTCYCGRTMQNKWKTRHNHIKSWIHKNLIQKNHLDMIHNNPKYDFSLTIVS